jgi:hypothetical protein
MEVVKPSLCIVDGFAPKFLSFSQGVIVLDVFGDSGESITSMLERGLSLLSILPLSTGFVEVVIAIVDDWSGGRPRTASFGTRCFVMSKASKSGLGDNA